MMRLEDTNLVLFFTRGVSLQTWFRTGILDREIALYQALSPILRRIIFVTHGDVRDLRYAGQLNGIHVICNRWKLPHQLYVRSLPWVSPGLWRDSAIVKSNQVQGADIALRTARRLAKKFIARCGYLLSDFAERLYGLDSQEAIQARQMEHEVFTKADRVVVTTSAMRETVVHRYRTPLDKVAVIPNYVQTDEFHPGKERGHSTNRICFVGRLDEQKNLASLLKGIEGLDVELLVVGNGVLGDTLRRIARERGLPVLFTGSVPNRQLPSILNSASVFILPSHFEGHPKALLEAMACGLPVIGTDVPGTREIIRHGETGYLCGTSPDELRAAIERVMGDEDLRDRMGGNARDFVVKNFALDRIVEMERSVMSELLAE